MGRLLVDHMVMILSRCTLFCDLMLRIKGGKGAHILTRDPDEGISTGPGCFTEDQLSV